MVEALTHWSRGFNWRGVGIAQRHENGRKRGDEVFNRAAQMIFDAAESGFALAKHLLPKFCQHASTLEKRETDAGEHGSASRGNGNLQVGWTQVRDQCRRESAEQDQHSRETKPAGGFSEALFDLIVKLVMTRTIEQRLLDALQEVL